MGGQSHIHSFDINDFIRQHFGGEEFGFGFNFFNRGNFHSEQTYTIEKEISYYQMICGGEIEVDTPMGEIKLTLPEGSFPGAQLKVRIGKQNNTEVFIRLVLNLKMPTNLSQEQKDKIKELGI
jgi:DnaJ-class molecular chaperone